jgi:predicted glycosyltransferase
MDAEQEIINVHAYPGENDYAETLRGRKWRIALYSHDTMGIGHMRRNLLIAQTLARSGFPTAILLISGAHELNAFGVPPGVDCLTLPCLRKEGNGHYQARRLDISLDELIALRSRTIAAALEAFRPDVFIVDKVPRGAVGELEASLNCLRADGLTRCVLGLRDVLDDPATVSREWSEAGNEDAIRAYYDAVWIYGDPAVYDAASAYRWQPEMAAKVRYTGYLDQRMRTHFAEIDGAELLPPALSSSERLVLCLLGGGQDGAALAESFAQVDFPPGTTGVILAGPFMPEDAKLRLRRRAAANPCLRVLRFVTDADLLLSRADRVVTMGGYNTVCEVLSFEKRALVVPRVQPRREQLIRTERLRDLGLLEMLHPDNLTPRALADWLDRDLGPAPRIRHQINLNGLANLPRLLAEVVASPPRPAPRPRAERSIHHAAY